MKRSCFFDYEFSSFRLVMRGVDPSSNILSGSVGPSEYGDCKNVRAPVMDQPTSGTIYYDEERIWGVEFTYNDGYILLVGNSRGASYVRKFSETSSFIGFYGR